MDQSEFQEYGEKKWQEAYNNEVKNRLKNENIFFSEGFTVKPLYTAEENKKIQYLKEIDFSVKKSWALNEIISIHNFEEISWEKQVRYALENEVNGLVYDFGSFLGNSNQFKRIVEKIDCQKVDSFVGIEKFLPTLQQIHKSEDGKLPSAIYLDLLKEWVTKGTQYQEGLGEMVNNLKQVQGSEPTFKVLVDGGVFQEAGGNAIHEIAFTLNKLVFYLDAFTETGIAPEVMANCFEFATNLGSNFLTEIAKVRALKLLISQIAHAYDLKNLKPAQVKIRGNLARWNKSTQDSYTNLVRNTVETIAAVFGGCEVINVQAANHYYPNDAFGRRMQRNVSHILKNEAHLNKVIDPLAGAYYLDHYTDWLLERSWELFLKVESMGGFIKAFEAGFIQHAIADQQNKLLQKVKDKSHVIVGVNKYIQPSASSTKKSGQEKHNTITHSFPLLQAISIEELLKKDSP